MSLDKRTSNLVRFPLYIQSFSIMAFIRFKRIRKLMGNTQGDRNGKLSEKPSYSDKRSIVSIHEEKSLKNSIILPQQYFECIATIFSFFANFVFTTKLLSEDIL